MKEQILIDALKEKWIQDFGDLNHELENVSGYFIAGFVGDLLKSEALHSTGKEPDCNNGPGEYDVECKSWTGKERRLTDLNKIDKLIYKKAIDKYCSPHGNPNPETYAYISGLKDSGMVKALEWIDVKDRPLFTKEIDDCWTLTDDGTKEFLAAVPYYDSSKLRENLLWWIRHCIIDDGGLKIVGDVDNEPAGWSLEDVTHWIPLPNPPKALAGINETKEK